MANLLKKLAALINVKTLVTFAVTAVFVVLSLQRFFNAETVMSVVVMVIGFYFGTQHEAKNAAASAANNTVGADGNPPAMPIMTSGYIAPVGAAIPLRGGVPPQGRGGSSGDMTTPALRATPPPEGNSEDVKTQMQEAISNGEIYIKE